MNYAEAINLAKAGDERGFGYLYQTTYQKKFPVALYYLKSEAAAEDAMQEAYLKAFRNLDSLENANAFPAWLGKIIANTSKNMLAKKQPTLFSELAVDSEGEAFEYQIEDDNIDSQPELAYTRQERTALIREMIDSLSDEQRLCIIMYHLEGASIREIAETMGCSENTVKSRLNYGRKNLGIKAETLQKKGYDLYSFAPLPLFLLLLRGEQKAMAADGTLAEIGNHLADKVFPAKSAPTPPVQTILESEIPAHTSSVLKTAATTAGKTGIFHTVAGKTVAVVLSVCLVGGGTYLGASHFIKEKEKPEKISVQEDTKNNKKDSQKDGQKEKEEKGISEKLEDGDYASVIAGNLSKEELEHVLAYGPQIIPAQGFQPADYMKILNSLCMSSLENLDTPIIPEYGHTEQGTQFAKENLNRMFLSFTDYQFQATDQTLSQYNIYVDDNNVTFAGASLSSVSSAEITDTRYSDKQIEVDYTHEFMSSDMGMAGESPRITKRTAILKPVADGSYRIAEIKEIESRNNAPETPSENETNTAKTSLITPGAYSFVASSGGARASMDISDSGTVTITEFSSGTGKGVKNTYQLDIDMTSLSQDGTVSCNFKYVDGELFYMDGSTPDAGDEYSDFNKRDRQFTYYASEDYFIESSDLDAGLMNNKWNRNE